jgi:hypothetical protein
MLNDHKYLCWLSMLLLLTTACHRSRPVKSNDVISVTLALGGGEKPAYWAIQADSSFHYQSYTLLSSSTGKFKGYISRAMWDSITTKLNTNANLPPDDTCRSLIDATYELIIHYAHSVKRVKGCADHIFRTAPDNFAHWFKMHCKAQLQVPTSDSLHFDTSVQYERKEVDLLGH